MRFDLNTHKKWTLENNSLKFEISESDLNTLRCIGIDDNSVLFLVHDQRKSWTNEGINPINHWSRVVVPINTRSYSASLKRLQVQDISE